MIFILHDKMRFCFLENMHEKPIEFGHMHENKIYLLFFLK